MRPCRAGAARSHQAGEARTCEDGRSGDPADRGLPTRHPSREDHGRHANPCRLPPACRGRACRRTDGWPDGRRADRPRADRRSAAAGRRSRDGRRRAAAGRPGDDRGRRGTEAENHRPTDHHRAEDAGSPCDLRRDAQWRDVPAPNGPDGRTRPAGGGGSSCGRRAEHRPDGDLLGQAGHPRVAHPWVVRLRNDHPGAVHLRTDHPGAVHRTVVHREAHPTRILAPARRLGSRRVADACRCRRRDRSRCSPRGMKSVPECALERMERTLLGEPARLVPPLTRRACCGVVRRV